MATCKISEYRDAAKDNSLDDIPAAQEPAVETQNITYTTSTASAAFHSKTRFIRIIADAKAHFVVGDTPTATATDPYVVADTVEYFGIKPGQKIAFYDGSS
ncbi:MAG: hypothetical protein GY942_03175 [Aestuariibacter sp.]|nr:hypothetical protein [Aestuariibacter sp.]